MGEVVRIPKEKTVASIEVVLKSQGVPESSNPDERTVQLAEKAVSLYQQIADPVGIKSDVSRADFKAVYEGEGLSQKDTPLGRIYGGSHSLALFAVTIGAPVCAKISELFNQGEFALGSMLDSVASEGSELAAGVIESRYREYLSQEGRLDSASGTMRFSPGYCGWDMSSQKKLFELLGPGEIGITLRKSFLMQPLKSISGVIVAGPKEIFQFDDDFSFCSDCDTHCCRDRIKAVLGQQNRRDNSGEQRGYTSGAIC